MQALEQSAAGLLRHHQVQRTFLVSVCSSLGIVIAVVGSLRMRSLFIRYEKIFKGSQYQPLSFVRKSFPAWGFVGLEIILVIEDNLLRDLLERAYPRVVGL